MPLIERKDCRILVFERSVVNFFTNFLKIKNMKNVIWLLLFIPILFAACDNGEVETGTVDLNIKAYYDNENLVLSDYYEYADGKKIAIKTLKFYMSDIKLTDGDVIKDAVLFDFYNNHSTAAGAANGETMEITAVPAGDYSKIGFGVGVSAALNATSPADYASNEGLSVTSMYWDWRGNYIFAMIEGSLDTTGNGQADVEFLYHMGADELYKNVNFAKAITVEKDKNGKTTLSLKLDAKKIFIANGETFDIVNKNATHSGVSDDATIAETLMANLANAITVE